MTNSEDEAIHLLQQGDIGGLEVLVHLYQLHAMRLAYGLTGNRQTAEDVVATAFLTAYERITQFDTQRPFEPWLQRIVINGALNDLRKHRRQIKGSWIGLMIGQTDPDSDPETRTILQEVKELLHATVWSLPPLQRAVVVLHYYCEMDERTIADTLGCPLGTVKWRLHAARRRLRTDLKRIDRRGWTHVMRGEYS